MLKSLVLMIDKPLLGPGPYGAMHNTSNDELKLLKDNVHRFCAFCIKSAVQLKIISDGRKLVKKDGRVAKYFSSTNQRRPGFSCHIYIQHISIRKPYHSYTKNTQISIKANHFS